MFQALQIASLHRSLNSSSIIDHRRQREKQSHSCHQWRLKTSRTFHVPSFIVSSLPLGFLYFLCSRHFRLSLRLSSFIPFIFYMMQPLQDEENSKDIEQWLTNADEMLKALEQDQTLGPTIRRFAFDLATVVGNLAREWDDADETQRRLWARSCLEEAKYQLQLQDESTDILCTETFSDKEWTHHVSMTKTLLLDVEESLKSIGSDEANEIADVAVVVLRIFLQTLKQWNQQLNHNQDNKSNVHVEILEESSLMTRREGEDLDNTIDTDQDHLSGNRDENIHRKRFLWPPMAPYLTSTVIQGQQMAIQNPILTVALAMTLWPTAIVACFVGVPLLATDWILQTSYNNFQHHPMMENLERGASNLMHIAKLYFLCSKLVIQQGIRVGKRQVHRRGGLQKTMMDIGGWTLDRIRHPVETVTMGSQVVMQGIGLVRNIIPKNSLKNTGVDGTQVAYQDCT